MGLTLESFSLGKLRQTLSQLCPTLLDIHGHIRDIGKKEEVLDLVVLLDQPLHILIVLSRECDVVVEKYVEGEDHGLLDVPLLKWNSSLNFIH